MSCDGNKRVASPSATIETRSLPALTYVLPPIATSRFAHLCRSRPRGSIRSLLPSRLYLDHSHCLVLAPATLAALPCTRASPDRPVFYLGTPDSSIPGFPISREITDGAGTVCE